MKTIVSILLGCLLLTACKKEKTSTRTLEGYLYKNCAKEPYVGWQLSVYGLNRRALRSTEEIYLGEMTTDENGHYSLTYESDERFNGLRLDKSGFGSIIELFYYTKKLKMVHYSQPTVQHKVILRVKDTLSAQDTLYISAATSGIDTLIGPFEDGQQFSITVRPNIGLSGGNEFVQGDRTAKGNFYWGLGVAGINRLGQGKLGDPQTIIGTPQPVCGQGGDIVIDLRGKH